MIIKPRKKKRLADRIVKRISCIGKVMLSLYIRNQRKSLNLNNESCIVKTYIKKIFTVFFFFFYFLFFFFFFFFFFLYNQFFFFFFFCGGAPNRRENDGMNQLLFNHSLCMFIRQGSPAYFICPFFFFFWWCCKLSR